MENQSRILAWRILWTEATVHEVTESSLAIREEQSPRVRNHKEYAKQPKVLSSGMNTELE